MSSFADISNLYANQYKTVIKFTHVWSEKVVSFKAFLTEYNDEYNTEWNSEQVYGRNDPIQTFKSTTRNIGLGWDVPAASFEEAAENMSRAALLVKFLYPTYDGSTQAAQTISRPPLVRVSFQNLIQGIGKDGLLCTMGGISFSPDLDAGWFDVGEGISTPNSSKSPLLYPKLINFNCQLAIMHESSIGWDTDSNFGISENLENFPFLNPDNKANPDNLGDFKNPDFKKIFSESDAFAAVQRASNSPDAFDTDQDAFDTDNTGVSRSDKREIRRARKKSSGSESGTPANSLTEEKKSAIMNALSPAPKNR